MFATAKDNKANMAKDGMVNEGGPTTHDIKATTHHFKDDMRDTTKAVRDDVEDLARRTGHHMRELADSAGHSIKGVGEAMTVKIRDNPIQSSVIALGIGVLLGMLYRHR